MVSSVSGTPRPSPGCAWTKWCGSILLSALGRQAGPASYCNWTHNSTRQLPRTDSLFADFCRAHFVGQTRGGPASYFYSLYTAIGRAALRGNSAGRFSLRGSLACTLPSHRPRGGQIKQSARMNTPEPNRTEPNRTEPNRTEPNRTEPNRTEPNRTEPNRTDPGPSGVRFKIARLQEKPSDLCVKVSSYQNGPNFSFGHSFGCGTAREYRGHPG